MEIPVGQRSFRPFQIGQFAVDKNTLRFAVPFDAVEISAGRHVDAARHWHFLAGKAGQIF